MLQVITPSRMSGAETQLVRMTARLEARGHTVATLVKAGSPAIPEMRRLGLEPEVRRISGKFNPASLAALARSVRRHRAEVVQSTTHLIAATAARPPRNHLTYAKHPRSNRQPSAPERENPLSDPGNPPTRRPHRFGDLISYRNGGKAAHKR